MNRRYILSMIRRGWTRHGVVAAGGATAALVIFMLLDVFSTELWVNASLGRKAEGELWRFNVATGLVALALLVVTVAIGPVRVLRGAERRPIHLPWRRVTGVWAAVFAVLHFPGGLAIHSAGWRIWGPFERILPEAGNLVDSYGVAYWSGLAALLLLIVLATTSRDKALRTLGAQRWKRLHLLVYPALALVIVHVPSMQYSERRALWHAAITSTVLVLAVAVQFAGFLRVRRSPSADEGASDLDGS
jgi:sulfoxide reductase heme-binding subunit YedZ